MDNANQPSNSMSEGTTSDSSGSMKAIVMLLIGLVVGALVTMFLFGADLDTSDTNDDDKMMASTAEVIRDPRATDYGPVLDPADFSTTIDNPYFNLPVGRTLIYEGDTEDGHEKIQIKVTDETRVIGGIETVVYEDTVWVDDELVEYTKDFLAQDKHGNVWYFGEEVDNYEDGVLVDHHGAWTHGVDGAIAGIWIKADHVPGDSYRQEYLKGEAEDIRDVLSVTETVTIGLGTYENCVKVYDWTPLDPESKEHKYYCKDLGAMVYEFKPDSGEMIELVETTEV